MLKDKRGSIRVDFLKLFKKSVAASLVVLIFGMQSSYASNITAGGGFGTNVTTNGNTITIDGGTIKGDGTGFHHFTDFELLHGDIANLLFGGADRFVNLVDKQIKIDGIFNAIKNGSIGGDVIFVSPMGMIVGASGIMNVGSLQTITPVKSSYDSLVGLGGSGISYSDIQNLRSDSKDSTTEIHGKIFSKGDINLAESRNLTIGENSLIVSGFNQNGFAKTQVRDLTGIVNADGIVDGAYMTNSGGGIKIVANNINSDGTNGLIQSMNDVSLDATAKGSINLGSQIKAGGDVNLGQEVDTGNININNKISADGKLGITSSYRVTQNDNADISAGSMTVDTGIMNINSNITANNGITINASNGIKQSDTSEINNNTSGDINLISYLSSVETNKITNKAGNITIGAGALNLNNTIDAQNGSINITAMDSIAQKDDTFTSLKAKKDLNIVTTADVGSSAQSVNVNVGGDVDITNNSRTAVYLKSKDADLSIKKITMASDVNLESGKKITFKQNVNSNGNLNIKAQEGVVQTSDSTIKTTGAGTINVENSTSGDVILQNVTTDNGTLDVANNASDGSVNINGDVTSKNNITISSQNGINQGASSSINLNGTADKNITLTNNGSGDVNLNNLFNSNGNITVTNSNGGALPPTPGNVNINGTITANAGTVDITSQGSISQSSDTTSITAGSDVTLNSKGNLGTEEKHIIVSSGADIFANAEGSVNLTGDNTTIKLSNITSGADLNISATENADIVFDTDLSDIKGDFKVELDKDLNIDSIIRADGNVSLISNNGDVILNALVTSTNESISVDAQGGIFQKDTFDGTTLNAQKDIILTAETKDVGTALKAIQLESKGSVAVNGGNVYLTSPGSLNIAGINKDKVNPLTVVSVTTTNSDDGNINFAGLVKGSDVTVSSAQGITQDNGIKSVEASGDLYLISKNGSIGETNNGINFSANTVSADSSESVVLTGIDTDIRTSLIKAKENIDLSTQITNPELGKGKIVVENNLITSENGYIRLNSAKSLEINNDLSAGKSITLNASGGIVQKDGTTITSGTNPAGTAGSGELSITNNDTGSITLGNVTANHGDVLVTNNAANENIILNSVLNSVDSNIVLTSAGNIVQNAANTNASLVSGGDITLKSLIAGSADKYILVDAGGSLNAVVNDIYAEDTTGDFTLGQIDAAGDVYLKADGNIVQSDYTKDAILSLGSVNLTSTNGNIGGTTPDKALVITGTGNVNAEASNIYLTSNNKLVTGKLNAQNDINVSSKSASETLELTDNVTANGNITINSASGINQTGGVIHKSGTNTGNINITAYSGQVALAEITNDKGNISVVNNTSAGNVVLNSVLTATDGDISINANGAIEQVGTQNSLVAGNNISLTSGGYSIGTVDQYLTFSAGNEFTANSDNGSLFLKTADSNIKTSNLTANGDIGINVSGTGNLIIDNAFSTTGGYIDIVTDKALNIENTLTASDYIKLTVDGAITQKAGLAAALNSGNDIILNANGNDIGADGNYLSINAGGQADADGNNIYLNTPNGNLNAGNINAAGDIKLATETLGDINLLGLLNGNNITINAVDGVYQTAADKTINARGALSLTSQRESIGKPNSAINFSAGSVSASAEKSVVLLGVDTDINTSAISAKENIDLSTRVTDPASEKGKITVASDLVTTNGYIKLDSAKSLEINNNIEAGQHITLNANGGIVQKPGSVIKGGTSASASDGKVAISNSGSGNISLDSVSTQKGDISVTNSAENGDIVLNSLVQASAGSVTVDSKGAIIQNPALSGLAVDALNNVTLNALNNVGSTASKIALNAGGNVSAKGNGIYLKSPGNALNLGNIASTGAVEISTETTGDININDEITGTDITLNSAESIYQTGNNKTITSSGVLSLTANNGNIGRVGNAIIFKANSVRAKALNGSVILNGIESDINTDSIISGGNIDLTTTTSGDINITEVLTADGYIKLNAAESVNVVKNINSTGSYIYIGAQDGITISAAINALTDVTMDTQGNIVRTAGAVTAGNDIILNAVGNVGALNGEIIVNAGNVLNAKADNIFVKDNDSDFVLGEIVAQNTANLTSVGDMTQKDLTKPAITAGGDITLSSTAGDIGKTNTNAVSVDTTGVVNAGANNIYLSSSNDLNTGTITASNLGNIDIRTTGADKDIVIKKLISGGSVILNAKGDVRQDSALNKTISTNNLDITSQSGNIGETNNAIDFSVTGTLTANAASGSVVLNGIDTDIYTNDITAGKSIDLSTENSGGIFVQSDLSANGGYIRLNSVEGLEINENLNATSYIELISQTGDILLDSLIQAGTDINLDAKGTIVQGTHSGVLTAGNDINLKATGNIGLETNKIKLNADNTVSAEGANVYIESPDKDLNISKITSAGIVDTATTTSGNINIKGPISGSSVKLNAVNGIYQDSTTEKTITAQNELILIAQNNDIGRTDNAIILEAGSVSADAANGSVVLNGIGTDINTNDITAGKNIDLSTTGSGNINVQGELVRANGYIKLNSAESLIIDKTLTSSDYIWLGAKDGLYLSSAIQAATDITMQTEGGITQTGGSLTSTGGKVLVSNDVSGGISLNNVTAHSGMNIVNSGNSAALITLGGLTTANGTINAVNTTGGNIVLASLLESVNGNVSINAEDGNVVQTGSGAVISAGSDVFLAGNQVGSEDSYINANAGNKVSANGVDIYLQNDNPDFKIGDINTNPDIVNNSVNIRTNNGEVTLAGLVKGSNVNIVSAKGIKQDAGTAKSIDAENVTFTANNGNVGDTSNAIDMTVSNAVNVTKADNVYLHGVDNGTDNALNVGNITALNDVILTSDSGIKLNGLINSKKADLTAAGNITQDSLIAKSIDADIVRLTSTGGDIGETGNAIDFVTGSLYAVADGSIVLNGIGINISTDTITTGKNLDLSTTGSGNITIAEDLSANGYIRLNSAESLIVDHNLTAVGFVELIAQNGDMLLSSVINATDVTLSSTGGINQQSGQILSTGTNGVIANNTTSGGITLNNVTASNGKITVTNSETADGLVTLGTINAGGDISVSNLSNNGIVLKSNLSGADITLISTGGVSQDTGNITSTGTNGVSVTNSNAGGIKLNNVTAQNGRIDIANDNTAVGSVILGALDSKGNVSISNLQGEIRLNSIVRGEDIALVSTGGISQSAGANITSRGSNGVTVTNSEAGGIQLNEISAANGNVTITNDETAGGSIVADQITAGKDISISNLSDNEIILKSNVAGRDISLVSTGGITQQDGTIISTGANGFTAQNSNSGSIELNQITSSKGVNIENSSLVSSDIQLKAITNTNGLVTIKNLSGGDVILNALVQSTNGSVVIDTADGDILQTVAGIALKAGDDITLKAGNTIGASDSFIKMNAGGNVYLDGSNIFVDSPDMDLNIAQIKNESGTVNIKTSGAKGSLTINDDISADDIALSAADSLVSNNDISSQNERLELTASNGDLTLNGNVSNTGAVILTNNSRGNGSVTVNNVNAGTSYQITNSGNGLVTVNGTLSNSADSSITASYTGSGSGLVIGDSAVLNNKNGNLTLTNKGQKGTKLGGVINNNFQNNSNVYIANTNGGMDITADINNGKSIGESNVISIINSGISDEGSGLNIISGTINNYGKLRIENNKGVTGLAGIINGKTGSINEFVNGTDNDMNIAMAVESLGSTFTFENKGNGSLIVDESAVLNVSTVQHNGTTYQGVLNLNNSSNSGNADGGISMNGTINNGSSSVDGGIVNITNKSNGGISVAGKITGSKGIINITNDANSGITFENGSNISTGSSLNIENNKGSLNVKKDANINSSSDIYMSNNEASQSVNFDGKVHGKNVVIQSNGSNVNIAHNFTDANISADNNLKITAQNADILNHSNTETSVSNSAGISAGGNIELTADNIGVLDNTLDSIINNGFELDSAKSIHVTAGGKITANSNNTLNLLAVNGNLNLDSVNAKNAILSALTGDISSNSVAADNLYAYAKSDSGKITLDNMNIASDIYAEAGSAITMNSNSAMNIESLLSRKDTININSEGNVDINEIAAAKDININVNDEKLSIINLGRVERAQDVIPENVNLTVLDSKRTPAGSYTPGMSPEELAGITPNSKLDIYNAYVQNKATLKADTITAQVYDISDTSAPGQIRVDKNGNQATGFHNANKNGKLLEFDIQGANYAQGNAGSNPHNPLYSPEAEDKRALNVNITLGDSVGGALYGANFKKLYADYAFIDSVNKGDPSAFSKLVLESGIIGEKAIFRNNLLRLDIDNTDVVRDYAINKHYNDQPDTIYKNKTSFNMQMYDTIIVENPYTPIYPENAKNLNPHRRVTDPKLDEKMTPVSAEEQDSSAVDADKSTGYRQINWIIRDKENEILGSSDSEIVKQPIINSVIGISKSGILVTADTTKLQKGENLLIDFKYKDIGFDVDGKITDINGKIVKIDFVNVDKLTSAVMLFLSMFSENL